MHACTDRKSVPVQLIELVGFYGLPPESLKMPLGRLCAVLRGAMQRERFEARKAALAIGWGLAPHQDPRKKMDLVELAGGMVGRELPRYGAMLYPFERHHDDGERIFSPPNEDE